MAKHPTVLNGQQTTMARRHRYSALIEGFLFKVTNPTPGTQIAGQTSYSATTPTFLLQTDGADREVVGLDMWLWQAGNAAGSDIEVVVMMDSTARYSSGGTEVTPVNSDMTSTTTATSEFYINPTCSAASANVRQLWSAHVDNVLCTKTEIDFEDGIKIGDTGSILVYTWAASTAPSWIFGFEFVEE
jgi:hypothetical protein